MYPTPPLAWGRTASPPLVSHGWPRGCAGAGKLGDELFLESVSQLSVGDSYREQRGMHVAGRLGSATDPSPPPPKKRPNRK